MMTHGFNISGKFVLLLIVLLQTSDAFSLLPSTSVHAIRNRAAVQTPTHTSLQSDLTDASSAVNSPRDSPLDTLRVTQTKLNSAIVAEGSGSPCRIKVSK